VALNPIIKFHDAVRIAGRRDRRIQSGVTHFVGVGLFWLLCSRLPLVLHNEDHGPESGGTSQRKAA